VAFLDNQLVAVVLGHTERELAEIVRSDRVGGDDSLSVWLLQQYGLSIPHYILFRGTALFLAIDVERPEWRSHAEHGNE
jgi:hypothetical protein